MSRETFIAENPPRDGRDYDCQCARCGSSVDSIICSVCVGTGETEPGELYEEDPNFYSPEDTQPCHQCDGEAAWWECASSREYCKEHPLKGRENILRGKVEWFALPERKADQ